MFDYDCLQMDIVDFHLNDKDLDLIDVVVVIVGVELDRGIRGLNHRMFLRR